MYTNYPLEKFHRAEVHHDKIGACGVVDDGARSWTCREEWEGRGPKSSLVKSGMGLKRPGSESTTFGGLTRSTLMSRIRGFGNSSTELRMAGILRQASISGWRRHAHLPGRPDFSWRREKVALFVDGCFWHGHHCGRNLIPRSNAARWREKISRNQRRDRRVSRQLRRQGWAVLRVWECSLRRRAEACAAKIRRELLRSGPTS